MNQDTKKTTSPVGKAVPRIDARPKVTGEAAYVYDMRLSGMLVGKMLRSPHAHAKIVKIDTSRARKLAGVKAVVTATDTPKIKFGSNEYFFPYTVDQLPLEDEKVRYIGDEIAAVAAVDEETANKALSLIDVTYEVLPAVFDPVEAMKPGAPAIHTSMNNIGVMLPVQYGDADTALKESDYVREDVFVLPSAAHAALEPHVAIGQCEVSTRRITLWTSTQAPFKVREALAKTLEIEQADIRVIKLAVGGGFGGKLEMLPMDFAACLLSQKAGGLPVKIACTREEEFCFTRRKHPVIYKLKSGVKKDGTLMAITGEVIADGGAYCSYGPTVIAACIMRIFMVYKIRHFRVIGFRVYTNNPICGAIRGFGGVQSGFAVESHMDLLARGIGMDPVEFRLKNATDPDTVTVNKLVLSTNGLKECIHKAAEASGWKQKFGKSSSEGEVVVRGIGIGVAADVMGSKMYKAHESAGTIIKVEEDGSVYVFTGAADTGQGSDTAMAQIAAQELGVAYERIRIKAADTEITPFDTGSFASRVTFISGNATKNAAADAKRQILEVVGRQLGLEKDGLDIRDEQVVRRSDNGAVMSFDRAVQLCYSFDYGHLLIGRGHYNPKTTPIDFRTGEGNISGSYGFEAQIAEVEVNKKTGQVRVLKMTDVHDIGYPINPQSVQGQIEGSILMGVGYTLHENLRFAEGRVLNPSFSKYRIPRSTDKVDIASIFVETNDPQGPFGAKGMGEASLLPTAAAIANAIHDAIGVRIRELPITPEKVLAALNREPGRE